jgi:succinate dehydrogenase/fumarate reductase flavoprotein subunit
MILINKKMDEFTLKEEIQQWMEDYSVYGKNNPLENRAFKLLKELKKKI